MGCLSTAIATYIAAKDGSRPWLMQHAFAEDAVLETEVKTDAISFPSVAHGRDAITDVLVRRFSADYENVYTFCLGTPPDAAARVFGCDWLVGMSRRDTGDLRVGCGRYDWALAPGAPLVHRLRIGIEVMEVLPPGTLPAVMAWLAALPYPWCPRPAAATGMPALGGLRAIRSHLGARR